MIRFIAVIISALAINGAFGISYYEHYAPEGQTITSGLIAEGEDFTLNGKVIKIYSGAFHYFRVHPSHWRDTLKKLRACGLNTLELYMAWNSHHPESGVFDFGNGSESLSPFLDVRTFVQTAQEEDLFVILRPGPYICSEWDFGGMPSWLLSDYTMHVRTSYQGYKDAAEAYIQAVGAQLADLTFLKGGPIIAVQVENEYGHFGYEDAPRDKRYLQFLLDTLISNGFGDALFLTSDSPADTFDWGALPGVLMTANFQTDLSNLDTLKTIQPNRPLMVMEFWTGWFDHWLSEIHVTRGPDLINGLLGDILTKNSSVNFYMFIGGTNFGFMAGANQVDVWPFYSPIVTSYDYDAPLTEAGDYGPKYQLFKDTLDSFNPLNGIVDHPAPPIERTKVAYGNFTIQDGISFQSLLDQIPVKGTLTNGPVSMEEFAFLNNGNGQSYGYAYYKATVDLPQGNSTLLVRGHVRDMCQVLINGVVVTKPYRTPLDISDFGFWNGADESLDFATPGGLTEIGFLVENLGRVNYGVPHFFEQKKGLWEGPIYVDLQEVKDWEVSPLEFRKNFVNSLTGWTTFTVPYDTPAVYRVVVDITSAPEDTFLDMRDWGKGVVFVNGFNLGRYWSVGPTKTLYLPAPLLNIGSNQFVIFEQYAPGSDLKFIDHLILGLLS